MAPTLRQLEYAAAVAKTRHFGRAAAACHVTQPGLSSQLKELEETLGVRLFERGAGRVLPTPAGEIVVAAAGRILAEVEGLMGAARGHAKPLSGTLRLGAIPTIAPYLLPRVLPRVRKAHPDLKLLLREERTPDLLAGLASNDIDVALLALPLRSRGITTVALAQDPLFVVVPPAHRLSKRKSVGEAELEGEEMLVLEEGHCLGEQALQICRVARAAERLDFRGTSLPMLVEMVAGGLGITVVPGVAVTGGLLKGGRVVALPLKGPLSVREIALAWRSSAPAEAELKLLAATIRGALA